MKLMAMGYFPADAAADVRKTKELNELKCKLCGLKNDVKINSKDLMNRSHTESFNYLNGVFSHEWLRNLRTVLT